MLTLTPILPQVKVASIPLAPAFRVMTDDQFSAWAGRQTELDESNEADDHRPTAGPDFNPTPEQMAEEFGYRLGSGGIEAPAPDDLDADELAAFRVGYARGIAALDAERDALLEALAIEHDLMDSAFGDPEDAWPASELAEARSFSGHPS